MNGYQMSADAYKTFLERGNPAGEVRADMERKITALEIMATTDRPTQYEIFNSSGFNDIVNGYIAMALDNLETDTETRKDILREIRYLFDTVTAEQAEQYYLEH